MLCDLLHGGDAPIVVTGAIRPASATGADGPANLLDAVRAAGDAATAGLGAIVAFAGELHAARAVRKSDSVSPRAFASPRTRAARPRERGERRGLVGAASAARRCRSPSSTPASRWSPPGSAATARSSRRPLAAGADGLVAVLLGAGHAPPAFLAACRAAARARSRRRLRAAGVRPDPARAPTASRAPSATSAPPA